MNEACYRRIGLFSPVTEDDGFFGHQDLTHKLEELVREQKKVLAAVVSDRRTGKTSILYWLERYLERSCPDAVFAFIPEGQSLSVTENPNIKLGHEIYDAVLRRLHQGSPLPETGFPERFSPRTFIAALRKLLLPYPEKQVFVAIDEFDMWLTEGAKTKDERDELVDLINALVEASQEPEISLPLQVVLTVSIFPKRLKVDDRQAIFRLKPFEKTDLEQMLAYILGNQEPFISEKNLEDIQSLSGGWPYYAKWILECAYHEKVDLSADWPARILAIVMEQQPGNETQSAVIAMTDALNRIYRFYLKEYERALMLYLGKEGRISPQAYQQIAEEDLLNALEILKFRGFVDGSPDKGYIFRIGLLYAWYQKEWYRFQSQYEELYAPLLPKA